MTPVVGSLAGEYIFSPLRQRIRAKPGKLDWADKAALFITDPLGVLNAETDRLLGENDIAPAAHRPAHARTGR